MRIEAQRYFILPFIFQCFYLKSMQRIIGLSQQLLKLQLPFPGNLQTQLRSDSNFIFPIAFTCFLDASISFFDIHQLFI